VHRRVIDSGPQGLHVSGRHDWLGAWAEPAPTVFAFAQFYCMPQLVVSASRAREKFGNEGRLSWRWKSEQCRLLKTSTEPKAIVS